MSNEVVDREDGTKTSNPNEGIMNSQTNQENKEVIFTNTRNGRVWFKSEEVECLVCTLNLLTSDAHFLLDKGYSVGEIMAAVKKNWAKYSVAPNRVALLIVLLFVPPPDYQSKLDAHKRFRASAEADLISFGLR
jgi:hypothetical protein